MPAPPGGVRPRTTLSGRASRLSFGSPPPVTSIRRVSGCRSPSTNEKRTVRPSSVPPFAAEGADGKRSLPSTRNGAEIRAFRGRCEIAPLIVT